jgi:hypothetical protein
MAKHDRLLIGLVVCLVIVLALFIVGASGSLQQLSITTTTDDGHYTITFTGWSEIIISLALFVAIVIKAWKK